MRILYHIPSPHTIYAGRTIYYGYKHAFEDMGHTFKSLTADDTIEKVFSEFSPDIFLTSLNPLNLRFLDLNVVNKYKKGKMKVFVSIPFWKSPLSKLRINETRSLSENKEYIRLIQSGTFGDIYFNVCDSEDERMKGFGTVTGYMHHTIPLAADKLIHFPEESERFKSDISFVGTNLPERAKFFKECVFPLSDKYTVKLYGQDWNEFDKWLGMFQKVGQYFNIPLLKSFRKPKLHIEDERRIYASSIISINVHEGYQKQFGGDCNERTFKIPACGGFEITDDVSCIRKYFKEGKEIVIAKDKDDWFSKIDYYFKNPNERSAIINAGRKNVLKNHTYHNRVEQMIALYKSI